jgi:ABC-type multidrug transport system fused ATPase/permease subunit
MINILKYTKPYYFLIILSAFACTGASLTTVMLTDFLKSLIDGAAHNTLLSVVIIPLIGIASNYLAVYLTGLIGARLLNRLRTDCINSLMRAPADYMSINNRGDIMERISENVETLADFVKNYFKDCLYVPIMIIVYSIYLFRINAIMALCCLLPLVILVPINIRYMKPIKMMSFEYSKKLGLTNNNIQEAFDGAATIKAYNLQPVMSRKYHIAMQKLLKISNRIDAKQYHLEPVSRIIQELPIDIALLLGGILVFTGNVTIGVLIAYISILRNLVSPLSFSYQLVVRSQMAVIMMKRIFEVIEAPEEKGERCVNNCDNIDTTSGTYSNPKRDNVDIGSGTYNNNKELYVHNDCNDNSVHIKDTAELSDIYNSRNNSSYSYLDTNINKEFYEDTDCYNNNIISPNDLDNSFHTTILEFKNVYFKYNTGDKYVLDNFNLKICKGTHIAFVGKSGSGKSTVLKLIATFLAPDSGDIKLYGNNYSELSPQFIREHIAYVSQDAVLFPMSVADNIRVGNPAATDEQIEEAIKNAGCENFKNTFLTECGGNLSGGQRQRLSLARALVKNADIYLFDEPTSALDSVTEAAICKTIASLPADKTIITVTHKLNTVADYDFIYHKE